MEISDVPLQVWLFASHCLITVAFVLAFRLLLSLEESLQDGHQRTWETIQDAGGNTSGGGSPPVTNRR